MRRKLFATLLIVCASLVSSHSHSATAENIANLEHLIASSDKIAGLEVLIAAGTPEAFYSRFGHAMLRFVKRDGDFATDQVVSFVADINTSDISLVKGVFGGYAVLPLVQPLEEFWKQYVQEEGRPLDRYIIVSDATQRAHILATLKTWMNHPEKLGDYTFFSNNCAGALAKLFDQSGFPHAGLLSPKVPTHVGQWLQMSLLAPYPKLQSESTHHLFEAAAKVLGISLQDFVAGKSWPENAAMLLESRFSDRDIKRMLIELSLMPYDARSALVAKHRFNNGGATLEETLSFSTAPFSLYELCSTLDCARGKVSVGQSFWGDSAWSEAIRQDDFAYWQMFKSSCDGLDCSYREDFSYKPQAFQKHIANLQLFLQTRR